MTDHRWQSLPVSPSAGSSSIGSSSVEQSSEHLSGRATASRIITSGPLEGPVWCIVVAGGSGTRYGALKQLEYVGGRRVIDWSLDIARRACDGVVAVVPADRSLNDVVTDRVVAGGATRSASVRQGLEVVPADAKIIVVHDAARPLTPIAVFERCIDAIRNGAAASIAAIAVTDTIKRVDDGVVVETIDRSSLVSVQTPQAFNAAILRGAHSNFNDATDDAALVEQLGGQVVVVEGDVRARKLTTREDLAILEAYFNTDSKNLAYAQRLDDAAMLSRPELRHD
jgi:2-C-methyl-D-erythritol 4-phosphate cytidylyltransferase